MNDTREIVKKLDLGLRHKDGMTSDEFISKYCKVFREYAFATRDDSLNEFEKEISHVLGMLIYYKRFCEILGFNPSGKFDPREFVWAYEDAEQLKQTTQTERANQMMQDALRLLETSEK